MLRLWKGTPVRAYSILQGHRQAPLLPIILSNTLDTCGRQAKFGINRQRSVGLESWGGVGDCLRLRESRRSSSSVRIVHNGGLPGAGRAMVR